MSRDSGSTSAERRAAMFETGFTPAIEALCRPLRVRVTRGPDQGLEAELNSNELRVGSGSENDLVLSDQRVLPQHCILELNDEGLRVRGDAAGAGIWLSGTRVFDATLLQFPSVLELGESELTIFQSEESRKGELLEVERFGRLVGGSIAMRGLFVELQQLARSDVNVYVEGEPGTGKTLVAKAIHQTSRRRTAAFVTLDCSVARSQREMLTELSEGGVDGTSLCKQAQGGTLFLHNVAALSSELQAVLFGVLQGDAAPGNAGGPRIIASSRESLVRAVRRGAFRADLYGRVAAARIVVPPLRDRLNDLQRLVENFLVQHGSRRLVSDLPHNVWRLLASYRWPGNVRELETAIEPWLASAKNAPNHSSSERDRSIRHFVRGDRPMPLREARQEAVDAFERDYLRFVLARAEGNITRAAATIEISRQMFHRLLRKHSTS